MTISVNATRTESIRTDTSNPYQFNYTPGAGTVIGIVLTAIHADTSTDHITGITYGGVAMQRAITAADTSTELGRADIWYLKGGVPAGTQQVSVSFSTATTDDIEFVVFAMNGGASTSKLFLVDTDLVEQNTSNPSRTMNYGGRTCVSISAFFYGGSAAPTPNANMTNLHTHDFTSQFGSVDMQTTPGTADFIVSYTANDDTGLAIASFTEALLQTLTQSATFASDDAYFTHSIPSVLKPSLFVDPTDAYFTHLVHSTRTLIQATTFASDDAYLTPTILRGSVSLLANLYDEADAYFTPKINVTIHASLYDDNDIFYEHTIPGTGGVRRHPGMSGGMDRFMTGGFNG